MSRIPILGLAGLTVCVLFYNTSDVMQIAKCNVEWFYDGCKEHKIALNPDNTSQVRYLPSLYFIKLSLSLYLG
jgi:hypothetical protein